jgi:hypothetical protein
MAGKIADVSTDVKKIVVVFHINNEIIGKIRS